MTDQDKLNQETQLNDAELEQVDGGRGQRYAYYTVVHGDNLTRIGEGRVQGEQLLQLGSQLHTAVQAFRVA